MNLSQRVKLCLGTRSTKYIKEIECEDGTRVMCASDRKIKKCPDGMTCPYSAYCWSICHREATSGDNNTTYRPPYRDQRLRE